MRLRVALVMVVWTEERWRSHTPPRLERRRAAHRRRRGRGHKPGCWGLHIPRRLERRGAAHQLAGRVQTNNPVWGGPLAVLGLAGKGRLASFSRHSHCMAGAASSLIRRMRSKWSRRDCSIEFGTTTGGDPACVSSSAIFERRLLRWINSATRVVCSLVGSHAPSREPFAVALSELTWSPAGLC